MNVCVEFGMFPTSECTLSYFVAFLFQEGLTAGSVKTYLSTVWHAQIAQDLGDPKLTEMPYFLKGMKRLSLGQSCIRLTISPDILRERTMRHVDGAMLWAAACMCFFWVSVVR